MASGYLEDIVIETNSSSHVKNINHRLPSGETILTALLEIGDTVLVTQAFSQGADANKANAYGVTPLEFAVRGSNPALAELLIQNGALVNQASRFGFSPLQIALCRQNGDMVKLLLKYGAEPNGQPNRGVANAHNTDALVSAIQWGNEEIVKTILHHGAVVQNTDTIATALFTKNARILDILLNNLKGRGLQDYENSCSLVTQAAQMHNCEQVKQLLEYGAQVTFDTFCVSGDNDTVTNMRTVKKQLIPPLAACIHYGCRNCFELLLQSVSPSSDINYVDQLGFNPLCHALLDSQWNCYQTSHYYKPGYLHNENKCSLRHAKSGNNAGFPLSKQRLKWAEDFLLMGANVKSMLWNTVWWLDERTHEKQNEEALHLLLRAYHHDGRLEDIDNPTSTRNILRSKLVLSVGLATDFRSLLLLHLDGYEITRSDIRVLTHRAYKGRSEEIQSKIKTCFESLKTNPRTLQNIAVISIREKLMHGSHGQTGNIMHAAGELSIPKALYNQITLSTTDGLVREINREQIEQIHRCV